MPVERGKDEAFDTDLTPVNFIAVVSKIHNILSGRRPNT